MRLHAPLESCARQLAAENVETAFAQLREAHAEQEILERELIVLTKASDQAKPAYQGGVGTLIDVLDADRVQLAAS